MIFFSRQNRSSLEDGIPWITHEAKKWLDGTLVPAMHIFEWGSGGSTVYYSKRCRELVSVEHDAIWFEKVRNKLGENTNIIYQLIPPENGFGYRSSDRNYKGLSFEKYCKYVLIFPDNYFDLVVVDGRARNDCIRFGMEKVKSGGFLMLDNSERNIYQLGINMLKRWKRTDFSGNGPINAYPWTTSVFQNTSH